MNILLSIKPEYVEKIFSGKKTYEFRKRRPREAVSKFFVYESHPSKRIVGWFSVRRIHSGSPAEIWKRCKYSSGIKIQNYLIYCRDKKTVHAFEIDETFRFDDPINPFDIFRDFRPPQDFMYLDRELR